MGSQGSGPEWQFGYGGARKSYRLRWHLNPANPDQGQIVVPFTVGRNHRASAGLLDPMVTAAPEDDRDHGPRLAATSDCPPLANVHGWG